MVIKVLNEFLPPAQTSKLGGISVGDNLNITNDGKLDIDSSSLLNNKITNCITEIPQDINLTLSNGTLTLKSGSKVYVPNGFESDGTTKKFDVVTISSDLTCTASINESAFIRYQYDDLFADWAPSHFSSGTSVPSGYNGWYYDTTANTIAYYTNGTKTTTNVSFPLGIATSNSTQITSIDQVFNGFGYIGSTVFALPGVKYLVPNGRNSDGSLNSISVTLSKITTQDYSTLSNQTRLLGLDGNGTLQRAGVGYVAYNNQKNHWYVNGTNTVIYNIYCGMVETDSNAKISSFKPYESFRAFDWNDFTNKIQVVSALPTTPQDDTLYLIPEET